MNSIFDANLLRRRKERAAGSLAAHGFLYREAAERLADRLADVKRTFPLAAEIGGSTGAFAEALAQGLGGVKTLVQVPLSPRLPADPRQPRVVADPQWLPFASARFDLVASVLGLHWIDDLPGTLIQIGRALKPDGLFLAMLPGGATLRELRESLLRAEADLEGSATQRIAPFVDVRDGAALLQRAGFSLPVADTETLTITYEDPFALLKDLRATGETNAMRDRSRRFLRRETLLRAMALYRERFSEPDGRVRATFELVTLTGWAPHASQQKPLRPGSAKNRLADALGTVERSTGEAPAG